MKLTRRQIHIDTLKTWDIEVNINKCISEMQELIEELRDWKTTFINGKTIKNKDRIFDERCDVENCLEKLDVVLRFNREDIHARKNDKMHRTHLRLSVEKKKN